MSSFKNPSLTERTYRIFSQLTEVVLTQKALEEFPSDPVGFKERVLFSYSHHRPDLRWLVWLALWWFQLEAFFHYFKPFTRLTPRQKDRYYKKWAQSSKYLRYILLRPLLVLIYSAFYSDPHTSQKLGFKEPEKEGLVDSSPPTGILEGPATSLDIKVEICVIGSGAGGAVVAKELAELGHEVLILEEGGHFSLEHFQKLSTMRRNTLIYRDGGLTSTLGVPPILLPTGKCIGGTTLINSGTCFRTPDKVLDQWRKDYGLYELTPQHMAPYFEKVERTLHVEPVSEELLGKNNEIIRRGVIKLGLHGEPLVRNVRGCQGEGSCIFGCPTGAKQSMEQSYLPLAFKGGAKIYPHCHVERLHTQGNRVYKIEAVFTDPVTGAFKSRLTVYPEKVVVACGTLHTPLLLKRSHLGGESGQLGKNLTIHPTAKMMGIFDEIVDGFKGVPQGYAVTDFEEEGLMYESVFFPPWLLATSIFQSQEKHLEIMKAYRHIGIYGFLVHDQCRGKVVPGPGGRPLVFYQLGKRERDLFVKGLKILGRIFFAAGAKKVYPTIRTIHEVNTLDELERLHPSQIKKRDLESAAFHPLGTCRMGEDPRGSVVNEEMRLHDCENVWVADGSIFPTSLGVNPQITIMAFATRCAELIHQGS